MTVLYVYPGQNSEDVSLPALLLNTVANTTPDCTLPDNKNYLLDEQRRLFDLQEKYFYEFGEIGMV